MSEKRGSASGINGTGSKWSAASITVISILSVLLGIALYQPVVASSLISLLLELIGGTAILLYIVRRIKGIRIGLLRLLLKWKGYAYKPTAPHSLIFFWLVGFLGGSKPKLFELQPALPSLPVPPLVQSCKKFLESVRPILSEQEFAATSKALAEFQAKDGTGEKLQAMLVEYAKKEYEKGSSWLWQYWEQIVYLSGRDPLPIFSNWYGLDRIDPVLRSQVGRAANVVVGALKFKKMIESQTLPPTRVQDTIPVCMYQYSRIFGTVRVPGEQMDQLLQYPKSRHIVVSYGNAFYKVNVYHPEDGQMLTNHELRVQFGRIVAEGEERKKKGIPDPDAQVAVLTSQKRNIWAIQRKQLIEMDSTNKATVEAIETALFNVVLDDAEEPPETVEALSHAGMHYNGKSLWFDKNFSIIFFKNGILVSNVDHTWSDASVMVHVFDFIYSVESTADHWAPDKGHNDDEIAKPERLSWKITAEMQDNIRVAKEHILGLGKAVDLHVLKFQIFGKGLIKKVGVSPDAFCQMAIQLAFYRMHKEFVLTYESAATVKFLHGRTETVRSCSVDSKNFVLAMENADKTPQERHALLRSACKSHVKYMRAATNGEGVDRHFLGLRLKAAESQTPVPFFADKAMQLPFRLSTSQTPAGGMLGGGFAPLAENGYGVSYVVAEDRLWFHISRFTACQSTDALKFSEYLNTALLDMCEVCRSDPELEKILSTRVYRMLRSQ